MSCARAPRAHTAIRPTCTTRRARPLGRQASSMEATSGRAARADASVTADRVGADRSGGHHRVLGRRQVDRDGGVRGRGLLLRRQPALGDDPLAGRAVHARRARRSQRAAVVSDVRGGSYFEGLAAMLDDLRASGRQPPRAVPRGRRADAADPLQGDAPPPSAGADGQRRRRHRARARAAGAAARAGRRRDRHERADRGDAAAQAGRRAAADAHPGPAGGHLRELRLQVRPSARRRPAVRRALPAQPALRARPAAADRRRPAGRRVHQPRRRARRASTSACTRCSTTCCRSTWPRARPTWWWRSAAPAAATARWRSPSTWPSATATSAEYLVEVVAPRRRRRPA